MRYVGPQGIVAIYYEPESTRTYGVRIIPANRKFVRDLEDVLAGETTGDVPPPPPAFDEATVRAKFEYWATELQARAAILLP